MKTHTLVFIFLWLNAVLFLGSGCKKQELVTKNQPKVVDLQIKGTKGVNDTLEFVKNGKVIAEAQLPNNDFYLNTKVIIEGENAEVQIRIKGQQQILATRKISADTFSQTINCYYDGDKVYGNSVQLKIKGFALNDELEFLLDGKVVGSGTGAEFPQILVIGIETGEKRKLQIRKKDESTFLLNKDIISDQAIQNVTFFYDGEQLFDKIDVGKPVNQANMLLSIRFSSSIEQYRGPADLILYITDMYGEERPTDFRIAIPAGGAFSTAIELPPLSEAAYESYNYKLVKRGTTDELPYDFSSLTMPVKEGTGIRNLVFKAGSSSILVLSDILEEIKFGPVFLRGTLIGISEIDIAEYFK